MKTSKALNLINKKCLIIIIISMFSFIQFSFSQEKTHFYINIGLQGFETSINTRIYGDFNAEAYGGYGHGYTMYDTDGKVSPVYERLTPFVKGAVRWNFTNKEKKRNYIGVQSKYSFGHDGDLDFNKSNLNELHLGIERNMGKRFIFNSHLGVGYHTDYVMHKSTALLTLGLTFKFNYLKF
ncbi:MAG: hypothetical protein LBE34_08025 [Flavobacteriaceae bacterium]|jgi:hypothetical protein|nr:hypothetical protein [Flavobacteriaceae bacterium]